MIGTSTTKSSFGLIDSNILIYAFDRSAGEKHEKAKAFLKRVIAAKEACVSIQNLVEFHYNATRKIEQPLRIEESLDAIMSLASSVPVFGYGVETISRALWLEKTALAHFWDALLAATMEENIVKLIYTEDADFQKIEGIKAINPLV